MSQLSRLCRRMITRARQRMPIDLAGGVRGTLLVVGTGRSGTTWLMETINHRNDYRVVFEGVHPDREPLLAHLGNVVYVPPDRDDPATRAALEPLLTGRLHSPWINGHNHRFIAFRRLVKEVRLNLSLGWVARQFPTLRILRIVRHPCAVALSVVRRSFTARWPDCLAHPTLGPYVKPFVDAIGFELTDLFDQMIARWCLDQRLGFQTVSPQRVPTVFYEAVCQKPVETLAPVLEGLGVRVDRDRLARCARTPSREAVDHSAVRTGQSLTATWQTHVTPAQLERAMHILRCFGLEHVYGSGPLPLVSPEEAYAIVQRQ